MKSSDCEREALSEREIQLLSVPIPAIKAAVRSMKDKVGRRSRNELILHLGTLSSIEQARERGEWRDGDLELRTAIFSLDDAFREFSLPDLLMLCQKGNLEG